MIVALAYKYVAVTLMLAEINFCAGRLHLPAGLPIKEQNLRAEAVFPPRIIGFAGRLDTDKYSFSFAKSGRLRFITKLDSGRGNQTMREYLEGLAKTPSIINTNEAYRLATNWLAAMDVDLQRLEKEHPPIVKQQTFTSWAEDGKPSTEILLPIFDVK